MRKVVAGSGTPPSALDALLSAEEDIGARLGAAAREADGLIAAATADATTIERDAGEALARELAALDERGQLAREALVRSIEEGAARTVLRYRSLGDADIGRLATFVSSEVTGLDQAEAR